MRQATMTFKKFPAFFAKQIRKGKRNYPVWKIKNSLNGNILQIAVVPLEDNPTILCSETGGVNFTVFSASLSKSDMSTKLSEWINNVFSGCDCSKIHFTIEYPSFLRHFYDCEDNIQELYEIWVMPYDKNKLPIEEEHNYVSMGSFKHAKEYYDELIKQTLNGDFTTSIYYSNDKVRYFAVEIRKPHPDDDGFDLIKVSELLEYKPEIYGKYEVWVYPKDEHENILERKEKISYRPLYESAEVDFEDVCKKVMSGKFVCLSEDAVSVMLNIEAININDDGTRGANTVIKTVSLRLPDVKGD